MDKKKEETKRDKFVRLAEARTNKTIKMIQLLGNLSDKRSYEFSDKDIATIFNAIDKELKTARQKFDSADENSKKSVFTLEK